MERELQHKNEHELSGKSRKKTGKERQLRPCKAPKVSNSVLESEKDSLGLRVQQGSEAQLGPKGASSTPRVHFTEKSQPLRKSTYLRFQQKGVEKWGLHVHSSAPPT